MRSDQLSVSVLPVTSGIFFATTTLKAQGTHRKTISLSALRKLTAPVMFDALGDAVQTAFQQADKQERRHP